MKMLPRKDNLLDRQLMPPWESLAENRILHLYGLIAGPYGPMGRMDPFSPEMIMESMMILNSQSHEPIKLVIDSPGGFISVGIAFYNIMQSIKAPVYTIGRDCSSMAAILLAAGNAGYRYIYPHSRVMLHLPQGQFQGDATDFQRYNTELQKDKETLVNILIRHGCEKPREEILRDMDRDFFLTGQEAVDYGICDTVITPEIYEELFGNLVLPDASASKSKKRK